MGVARHPLQSPLQCWQEQKQAPSSLYNSKEQIIFSDVWLHFRRKKLLVFRSENLQWISYLTSNKCEYWVLGVYYKGVIFFNKDKKKLTHSNIHRLSLPTDFSFPFCYHLQGAPKWVIQYSSLLHSSGILSLVIILFRNSTFPYFHRNDRTKCLSRLNFLQCLPHSIFFQLPAQQQLPPLLSVLQHLPSFLKFSFPLSITLVEPLNTFSSLSSLTTLTCCGPIILTSLPCVQQVNASP